MCVSNIKSALVAALSAALISGYFSQNYSDLEALGVNCPSRDECRGYRNNLTYMDRSCECDIQCAAYKDCCIDAPRTQNSRPAVLTNVKCLHYGEDQHTGIFAISKCSRSWKGPRKIREKCVGADDFTDPLLAAPMTDVARKKTYRNLACAQCNNANLTSLATFQLRLSCRGLRQQLTTDQIISDLTYNGQLQLWGVNRLNRFRNGTEFFGCDIRFNVPAHLNNSVRFCRSNLISTCASNWTRPAVASLCAQYMTVVYSNTAGYRNPHCAICNHKTVDDISCETEVFGRKNPFSFGHLVDFYRGDDGEEVGVRQLSTPVCSSQKIYDPFFKRCRQLVCALPSQVVVDGRCTSG